MSETISPYAEEQRKQAAKTARLRYVKDDKTGITRKKAGKAWQYFSTDGKRITDKEEIERINKLAIPPAYTDVWISPFANGHMQATGRDARGRKQYRYHADWGATRAENKFERVQAFGEAISAMRARIEEDLRGSELSRTRVLAAVLSIMEKTHIRVGNAQYAKENQSYGITTLRSKHVKVQGARVIFDFKGKSNTQWHVDLEDKRLAKLVRQCEEIPGYEIFKYIDENGNVVDVTSDDVNEYIREISGKHFTAKDFRTWGACREAFETVLKEEVPKTKKDQKSRAKAIICSVAETLGHTPAVCKKSYIHPCIIDAWEKNQIQDWLKKADKNHEGEQLFMLWWKKHVAA